MKKLILLMLIASTLLSSCKKSKDAKIEGKKEVVETKQVGNTTEYTVNSSSVVEWKAFHALRTVPRYGIVPVKSGTVTLTNDQLTAGKFVLDISNLKLDIASVGNDEKDHADLSGHLKSKDFFNIEEFPIASFEITQINTTKTGEKYSHQLSGNLSIKDITKNITFLVNMMLDTDQVSIISETFTIDRTIFNLTYNVEGAEGVVKDYAVSKDIDFTIKLSATK